MSAIRRAALVAAGLLVLLAADARADPPGDGRTLGGHTFVRPVADDSAFLPTSLGFRQGVVIVDAGEVATPLGKKGIGTAAAIESLDFNVRVVEWLGIAARADLSAVVGASEVALYSVPSSVAAGLRFGPVVRVLDIERSATRLTLRPYATVSAGALVDASHVLPSLRGRILAETLDPPTDARDAIVRALALENDLVAASVTPLRRFGFGGSVHVAQALGPHFGLQLSYGIRRERILARPFELTTRARPDVALVGVTHAVTAALTFDAIRAGIPVGLSFESVLTAGTVAREGARSGDALDTVVLFGPGLHYTGRKWSQIGAFFGFERGLSPYETLYGTSTRPRAYYLQLTLRQIF